MARRSFLLVHGTGVRSKAYAQSLDTVTRRLNQEVVDARVIPCLWGDTVGARLNADGASIPEYDKTKGLRQATPGDVDATLWQLLLDDPLYELRLLAGIAAFNTSIQFGQLPLGETVDRSVQSLELSLDLRAKLDNGGILDVFEDSISAVRTDSAYREALLKATDDSLGELRPAIARAIVACAIVRKESEGVVPRVALNGQVRDELFIQLVDGFGGGGKSLGSWAGKQIVGLALRLGAFDRVRRKRGALTDATYPATGDILLYQAAGSRLRDFIRDRIHEAGSDLVILAHSLGGVACVDLLAREIMPEVKMLVTVGSQAPYFYELDALYSLRFGEALRNDFPRWLNIYDLRDLLSFIGEALFPGRVEDLPVDNKVPFPYAHSGYWENPLTWDYILKRVPK